jgi:hypothetical protein
MSIRSRTALALGTAGAVGMTLLVPPTLAAADDDVERKGTCSNNSRWELELEKDDGRIEVEFEVTTKRAGQKWRVRILQNDTLTFKGTRVAKRDDDDRPDFEVEIDRRDRPGVDRFRARAVNTVTGEVCVGRARI